MPNQILIFKPQPLHEFSPGNLLEALKAVSYKTLCRQYGLDPALIALALAHLAVESAKGGGVPYFLVRYQPATQPPIIVSRWDIAEVWENADRTKEIFDALPLTARDQLSQTRVIYRVALEVSQLSNLGLLLAYEIARWTAGRGRGFVYGLDGVWYRLNAHQAFIPLS